MGDESPTHPASTPPFTAYPESRINALLPPDRLRSEI